MVKTLVLSTYYLFTVVIHRQIGLSAGFGDWSVATLVHWRIVGSGGGGYHEAYTEYYSIVFVVVLLGGGGGDSRLITRTSAPAPGGLDGWISLITINSYHLCFDRRRRWLLLRPA